MVSFVSVGDGSVNNAHFLSAVNLAEYAMHRSFKCPVVFVVTDNDVCKENDQITPSSFISFPYLLPPSRLPFSSCPFLCKHYFLSSSLHPYIPNSFSLTRYTYSQTLNQNVPFQLCISLRGYDYVKKQWLRKLQMPFFSAHGDDFLSIYTAHSAAAEQARTSGKPALVYVGNIKRRFGHAATDRQNAYLTVRVSTCIFLLHALYVPTNHLHLVNYFCSFPLPMFIQAAEIKALAEHNPLEPFVQELVDGGVFTSNELVALWDSLQSKIRVR